jgi:nitrite reductase/ring-hydroxylating ferredoxin subunit
MSEATGEKAAFVYRVKRTAICKTSPNVKEKILGVFLSREAAQARLAREQDELVAIKAAAALLDARLKELVDMGVSGESLVVCAIRDLRYELEELQMLDASDVSELWRRCRDAEKQLEERGPHKAARSA